MFKNTLFTKAVCITTIYAFGFAIAARPAVAQMRLSPTSFNQMYELAHDGDVESLRASMYRGMSIDSTNSNGDTGLCLAARRHDVHAYNAFVAAGANPRHPCTQNVRGYSSFVNRDDVIGGYANTSKGGAVLATSKSREGISPIWWWIGGGAIAAAIIWALAGGGGGGGGGGSAAEEKEAYDSLGRNVATNGKAFKVTSGTMINDSIMRNTNKNAEKIVDINLTNSLNNTTYMDALIYTKGGGTYSNSIGVLLEAGTGTVAMNAIEKSAISNKGYIKVDGYNAAVGMVASEQSTAVNYGTGLIDGSCSDGIGLNFSGYKNSDTIVGMYADTASAITNSGDISGTAIEASTDPLASKNTSSTGNSAVADAVSGTNSSSAINTLTSSTASLGTMIGMEALLVNMGKTLNTDTIKLTNNVDGKIVLTAGDSGAVGNEIKVSLVGMGSFLHTDFLNKSFSLKRAENVSIYNIGTIDLSYTGNYTSTSATALRKGLGGIIGIRADANTNAVNQKEIKITLYDEYKVSGTEVAAGMQSVHGGNLTNSGNISIFTPSENARINYGMVAVEGTGSNSSLYSNINPELINEKDANINIQIGNSYGMASYVGGSLENKGTITLGSEETRFYNNIAMYGFGDTKRTELINKGIIDVYSHKSMAMQNDYSGGTDITNDGTINIHESATDSYVFGGAYSKIYNKGIINYDANATNPGEIAKEGITYDPFKNYSIALGGSIISTQARTLKSDNTDFSSSTTEAIYNEKGAFINMNGSSYTAAMAVEVNNGANNTQAKAINNGTINIKDREVKDNEGTGDIGGKNATNAVGMYMDANTLNNAALINNGKIISDSNFSIAMVSESKRNADMVNNGTIETNHENSAGMYATEYTNMSNNKDILIKGKNSIGVYVGIAEDENSDNDENTNNGVLTPRFTNNADARIVVGSADNKVENSFGIYGQSSAALQVENSGTIDMYTTDSGAAIYTKGKGVKINNNKNINIFGDKTYGIYTGAQSEVTNGKYGVITIGTKENPTSGSIGIMNEGDDTKITNKGDIELYNKNDGEDGYAIYSTGNNTEIKNEQGANIYLHNGKSIGIYAEHGVVNNSSTINIENNDSAAIKISQDAVALNDSEGIINIGAEGHGVNNSNGIISADEATGSITNKGEINLWNGSIGMGNSHAISAGGSITVTNERYGKINSYENNSDIIQASGNANIINRGDIYGIGDNVTAIHGYDKEGINASKITVENAVYGKITIGDEGTTDTEGYGIEANDIESIINRGKITVNNNQSYGIYAKTGTSIINDEAPKKYGAKIKMTGENSVGIYGGKVTNVTNSGVIETFARTNKAISTSTLNESNEQDSVNQNILNTGDLILHNANQSYGIYALGAVSIKSTQIGTIVIGYDANDNPLQEDAKDGYGIYAKNATTIVNDSLIKIYASGNAITGSGSIENTGKLYLHGDYSKGISSNGTDITNSGKIEIDGATHSYGIYTETASDDEEQTTISVSNKKGGDIIIGKQKSSGAFSFGIYSPNGSTISNLADITIYATNSNGITGGDSISNNGKIQISGQDSKGISSNGTDIINENVISIGHSQNSYGIFASSDTNTPTIRNTSKGKITIGAAEDCTAGSINCAANGHGIFAEKAASITNYADIMIYAQQATGITGGTNIYNYSSNGRSGAIHIVGRQSKGIYGNEINSGIYNEGKINIDDANGSFGIYANDNAGGDSGTSIQNLTSNASITVGTSSGEIGTSAHGIYAVNANSIINQADISIYAQGDSANGVDDSLQYLPLKAGGITGGKSITNSGVIHITGGEAHGIYGAVNNTSINNSNNIFIDTAAYSYGIRTANSPINSLTILNRPVKQSDNIKIVVGNENDTGFSSHGIFAVGADNITNYAAVTVYAKGANMPVFGDDDSLERLIYKSSGITGGGVITNYGVIHVTGGKEIMTDGKVHGIYGAYNNTGINNNNNIKVDVADFSFGIRAYKTAQTNITNSGEQLTIIVGKTDSNGDYDDSVAENVGISSHGIFALAAKNITNTAAITVLAQGQDYESGGSDDSPDVLLYKTSGITGGEIINNSGVIYLTGGKAHGIYGAANNTSIINKNRIRIRNSQDSYGIRTSDSAKTIITNVGDDLSIIIGTEGVTDNQTNAHGIYARNAESTINSDAEIKLYASYSSGVTGGKSVTNNGTIYISGTNNKGLESDNAEIMVNNKSITIGGADNSYGIYAGPTAQVSITNNTNGTIKIGEKTAGSNAHGIYATGAQSIDNNAEITLWSDKASGITGGAQIKNTKAIHIIRKATGDIGQNKGIESQNTDIAKTTKITNSGTITVDNAQSSYGIYTADDAKPEIENSTSGVITIGQKASKNPDDPESYANITDGHGIYSVNSSKVTNNAPIYVYASGFAGSEIYASGITGGSMVENNGNIILTGNYAHAIESRGTTVNNTAPLMIYGPNGSAGIYSTGSAANINNASPEDTGSSTRKPNITIGSNDHRGTVTSYGIFAENASKINNDGIIRIYSDKSYGIYSQTRDKQTVINNGAIYMPEDEATGIYTNGNSTINNYKPITIYLADSANGIRAMGAISTVSNITNSEDGIITIGEEGVEATDAHGLYLEYGGNIENDGRITIYASESYGIYNTVGTKINNNGEIRVTQGNQSVGIYSGGTVTLQNDSKGEIIIGGDDKAGDNAHGIKALSATKVTNSAKITVYGKNDSILGNSAISAGGAIINSGEGLFVSGPKAKGIYSVDAPAGESGQAASSSVNNSAKIEIPNANDSYGIQATGNVTLINSGDVTVGTDGDDAYNAAAIYTAQGTSLNNSGVLKVYAQDKAYGIYGGKIKTLTNSGEIDMYQKTGIIGIYTTGDVTITNDGAINVFYAHKNYGIKAVGGTANITNNTDGVITIGTPENSTATADKEAYGIYAENAGTIKNSAPISVYASESFGIRADIAESITNGNRITLPFGSKSSGIYSAQGKKITNNSGGKIEIGKTTAGELEYGIYAPKSDELENSAEIDLYGQGVAIYGHNKVVNSGELKIDNTGFTTSPSKGIYSNGDSIDNSDTNAIIDIYKSNGSFGIDASGATEITNKAKIIIGSTETVNTEGESAYGIRSTNGTSIDNEGEIIVNAKSSYGIFSQKDKNLDNKGNITLQYGEGSTGISANGNAELNNSGQIKIAMSDNAGYGRNYGIMSTGSGAKINNQQGGSITIGKQGNVAALSSDTRNYGIYAANADTLENYDSITIHADHSQAISSILTNKVTNNGQLVVTGGNSKGIYSSTSATSRLTITNLNGILLAGETSGTGASNSSGIESSSGGAEVSNSGTITIGNSGTTASTGLLGIGIQSGKITNNGEITLYGSGTAINGYSAETISNSKALIVAGNSASVGIYSLGGTIDNSGNITLGTGGGCTNCTAINGNSATSVINQDNITLLVNGSGTGIYTATGNITNNGTIDIRGTGHGIDTASEGTITNKGNIYVGGAEGGSSGSEGIRAAAYTIIVDNEGTIVVRDGGYGILRAISVTNQQAGKIIVERRGIAVVAKSKVQNAGIIATYNGNTIQEAATVNNDNTGTIEIKYDPSLGGDDKPFDIIQYAEDATGGTVTNSGYMHTEWGAAVRNASSFTNLEKSTLIVNGNDSKDKFNNPTTDATTAKNAQPVFENVTNIINNGFIRNYLGPIAIGTSKKIDNDGGVMVVTAGAENGVFQGSIKEITNSGKIIKDPKDDVDENGYPTASEGIAGPVASGTIDTFTNSGLIHVDYADGVFIGNYGTINNSGTIVNEGGPFITADQNVKKIVNSGLIKVKAHAIRHIGSIDIDNSGTIDTQGEHWGIYVTVPNTDVEVNINNRGTINGGIKVVKNYAFVPRLKADGSMYWTPGEDKTTVNPGEAETLYCWDGEDGTCMSAEEIDEMLENNGVIVGNHYFEQVDLNGSTNNTGNSNRSMSTMSVMSVPVTLDDGRTVNVVMLGDGDIDTQAVEAALDRQEETSDLHNSLIWANDTEALKTVTLRNSGTVISSGDVDFGEADENSAYISVGKDGTFEADSFAGKLRAEPSIVQGGFETTYVNKDTLVGEDKGVEFVSQSYMFDASSQQNDDGNTDVVMTMKPFAETVDDAQISEFLATNYEEQHGEQVFDLLKVANTKNQLYNLTRRELGFTFVPNLAKQSLDIEQTVGRNVTTDLLELENTDDRVVINTMSYNNRMARKGETTGYSDQVEAMYGFMDKNYDNGMRLGFGLEAIRADSSFDDDSDRYNNMVEAFVPVVFDTVDFTALIKPKAGFARGHYRRVSTLDTHKATTKEYYYGVDAAIKQNYDLGLLELEPQAEVDVTGMYIDDINESRNGLRIQDKNTVSAQSVLSLEAKKKLKLSSHSVIAFGAGGKYIHEFGSNYKTKASISDMIGYYDIVSNRIARDYGILNMKAQFDYRDLTLDASANMPLDDKQKTYYMFNAKYKF